MRTEFASMVVFCCISINSFAGKLFEVLADDKTTRLSELSKMGRVCKLLVGEELPRMLEVGKMFELSGEDAR